VRQPIGRGLQHIQSWLPAALHDPFTRWCNGVHHREPLTVPGFLSMRRFELAPGQDPDAAGYLTVYQLADVDVVDSEANRVRPPTAEPIPPEVAAALQFVRTIYRQMSPPQGWWGPAGPVDTDQAIGAAVAQVLLDVEPDAEADLNAWYDEVHLDVMLAVPGVLSARRFVDRDWAGPSAAGGRSQYVTLYELDDAAVATSPEFAEATTYGSRRRVLDPRVRSRRLVYRQVFPGSGPLLPGM